MPAAPLHVALDLEPAHGSAEGFQRVPHLARSVHGRDQAARSPHDVDSVGEHGDAQAIGEAGVARAFEALKPSARGSNEAGSIFSRPGFWKIRNAEASP